MKSKFKYLKIVFIVCLVVSSLTTAYLAISQSNIFQTKQEHSKILIKPKMNNAFEMMDDNYGFNNILFQEKFLKELKSKNFTTNDWSNSDQEFKVQFKNDSNQMQVKLEYDKVIYTWYYYLYI